MWHPARARRFAGLRDCAKNRNLWFVLESGNIMFNAKSLPETYWCAGFSLLLSTALAITRAAVHRTVPLPAGRFPLTSGGDWLDTAPNDGGK
jgi:hypothetical protein